MQKTDLPPKRTGEKNQTRDNYLYIPDHQLNNPISLLTIVDNLG